MANDGRVVSKSTRTSSLQLASIASCGGFSVLWATAQNRQKPKFRSFRSRRIHSSVVPFQTCTSGNKRSSPFVLQSRFSSHSQDSDAEAYSGDENETLIPPRNEAAGDQRRLLAPLLLSRSFEQEFSLYFIFKHNIAQSHVHILRRTPVHTQLWTREERRILPSVL